MRLTTEIKWLVVGEGWVTLAKADARADLAMETGMTGIFKDKNDNDKLETRDKKETMQNFCQG